MKKELLEKLFSISLKSRILRDWLTANRADDQEFSERELLTLELINDFGPIVEKSLCKIFGLAPSSISDLVRGLAEKGAIDTLDKMRGKPLELTDAGRKILSRLKQMNALRLTYLFESGNPLSDEETDVLLKIYDKMDKNAEMHIQRLVFDRYHVEN